MTHGSLSSITCVAVMMCFSSVGALVAQDLSTVERKVLAPVNRTLLLRQEEDRQRNAQRPQPSRFAVSEEVSFTPANSGVWEEAEQGRTWRLRLYAPDALSLNLGVVDLAGDVASYAASLETDPARLAAVSERRAALTALTRKYGETIDEVILLNEKDEVCEGTISNVFVDDGSGTLLTPPLSSGCLAGVLRTSLICSKRARNRRLTLDDLTRHPFYVGNSLRGLIRATFT